MVAKTLYVVWSPRYIFGIYEDKQDALEHFGNLFEVVEGLQITKEFSIPSVPF